ncbi:hypothetical protein WDZ92_31560, partial [Nostoc sp. NIES-2111]
VREDLGTAGRREDHNAGGNERVGQRATQPRSSSSMLLPSFIGIASRLHQITSLCPLAALTGPSERPPQVILRPSAMRHQQTIGVRLEADAACGGAASHLVGEQIWRGPSIRRRPSNI